jgi:hypothetical protein
MEAVSKSKRSSSKSEGRVSPCDEKLVKQLAVRLSVAEYNKVVKAANSQGRTASNYLRRVLVGIEKGI